MALLITFIILENLTLLIFAIEALIKNKKRKENEFIFDPFCKPTLEEFANYLNLLNFDETQVIYQGQDYGYFNALTMNFNQSNLAKFILKNTQLKIIKIMFQDKILTIYVTGQGNKNSKD